MNVWIVEYSAGRVRVGRRLTIEEAERFASVDGVRRVFLPKGRVHYFPDCGRGGHKTLARSLMDTTCLHCLKKRARQLCGWRWTADLNAADVKYLTEAIPEYAAQMPSRHQPVPPLVAP